jgi:multiple sugar transport system permease protein
LRTTPLQRALLLAPAALLLAFAVGLPVLRVLQLSLSRADFDGGISARFAGLAPFARLWTDGRWLAALRNTAVFTGASVLVETLLGVAFALLLDRPFRGRGLVRAVALVPWALPTAVMALAWAWIFNDSFGVANDLLVRTGLISAPVAWLARPATAMAALVIADAWKTTPFVAIIVLAGLQAIPRDVLEAARLDGLGPVRTFFRVTLPLLLPAILVAAVFRAVQSWGAFDIVWVLTGGGPGGSTETVSLYAYRNDFRYLDFAYGSTIATQAALLGLALAAVALRLGRRRAEEA